MSERAKKPNDFIEAGYCSNKCAREQSICVASVGQQVNGLGTNRVVVVVVFYVQCQSNTVRAVLHTRFEKSLVQTNKLTLVSLLRGELLL